VGGNTFLFLEEYPRSYLQLKYRHIFFDLDRTLWDFETNALLTLGELYGKYNLSERGVSSFMAFLKTYTQINDEMWAGYGKGTITKEDLRFGRFYKALADHGVNDEALSRAIGDDYIALAPSRTALFPHTIEALEYLSAKYPLYILTNGFEESQHVKLQNAGLTKYFKEVITSERAGYKKPDTRMFQYALELANAGANESIMIGDALEIDIEGARNAGMDQVFFNPARHSHNEKVTYEISSLHELMSIL
jgi:putative hydrolase of the HAD superfamily